MYAPMHRELGLRPVLLARLALRLHGRYLGESRSRRNRMEHPHTSIEVSGGADGRAQVRLAGVWSIRETLPEPEQAAREVEGLGAKTVTFDAGGIERWDSGLLIFLLRLEHLLKEKSVELDREGLPEGVRQMLTLAEVVPEREDARGKDDSKSLVARLGAWSIGTWKGVVSGVEFLGHVVIAFGNLARG